MPRMFGLEWNRATELLQRLDEALDGFPGVFERLLIGFALGMAARQSRHGYDITALVGRLQLDGYV